MMIFLVLKLKVNLDSLQNLKIFMKVRVPIQNFLKDITLINSKFL